MQCHLIQITTMVCGEMCRQNTSAHLYPLLIETRIEAHTNKHTKIEEKADVREICVSTAYHHNTCVCVCVLGVLLNTKTLYEYDNVSYCMYVIVCNV